jgi:exopolysaccharide biosynthesis predicted pyruvyltransferase EpsI
MTDGADAALLDGLRHRLDRQLAEVLGDLDVVGAGASQAVALVNFPNHANAGDVLLWQGARACLRRLGVRVAHRASPGSYDPVAVRAAVGDGPVLLGGGGNVGDVYRRQQEVRDRVLDDFADRTVVQLPQSVWFRDPRRQAAFGARVAAHGAVRFMARDEPSLLAAETFGAARVDLVPDLAFGLPGLARRGRPVVDVLWLTRHDPEAHHDTAGLAEVSAGSARTLALVDWLDLESEPVRGDLAARVASILDGSLGDLSGVAGKARPLRHRALGWAFDQRARMWVDRGVEVLSRGRVVVTERLHGHLMCMLAGIPHVVLDSHTGKIGAIRDAWSGPSRLARWADDPAHAWALAEELCECG